MYIERSKICVIFYIHPAPGDVGALYEGVMTVHIRGAIVDIAGVERDVSRGAVDGRVVDLSPHPVTRLEWVEHPTCTWINVNFKRIGHVFEKSSCSAAAPNTKINAESLLGFSEEPVLAHKKIAACPTKLHVNK